jgi:hypothetical protein
MPPTPIEYSALDEPITRDEVKAFRVMARSRGFGTVALSTQISQVVGVSVAVIFALVFVAAAGATVASSFAGGMAAGDVLVAVIILALIAAAVVLIIRGRLGTGGRWAKWMRLQRFADANSLLYRATSTDPTYPGVIFNTGDTRVAYDHFSTETGRFVDFGNYRYSTGSGKSRTTHNWGFLAISLDRALPNMVLDSRANNGLFGTTDLPTVFSRNQSLELEGDFNKYFTLYCPREYERDALYVFTPDLMGLLIDDAAPFDVEIVDKWMFVYSATAFDSLARTTYQRLYTIIDNVGAKTLSQTDRYHDERIGSFSANLVAPQGRRLKRGVSISSVILFSVVGAYWLWGMIADWLPR